MNGYPRWNRVRLYSLSGIFLLLSLFVFSSCEVDKVDVSFSQVYIRNLLSTNTIDQITNIEKIPYNANTMSRTVEQMENSATRNNGLNEFINNKDTFPWKTSSQLAIEYQQSYSIYLDNCEQPVIIRIDNGHTNLNEYDRKYFYALLDPPYCGINYHINIEFE